MDDLAAFKRCLSYCPSSGTFTRLERLAQRHVVGDRADFLVGGNGHLAGYRRVAAFSKRYLAHRLAWFFCHGEWPNGDIDHINGDKEDNRISNLRIASKSINAQNQRRPRADGSSGFLGAHRHNDKWWRARISAKGKMIHLGLFETPEEAHAAYIAAKRVLHAGCTI